MPKPAILRVRGHANVDAEADFAVLAISIVHEADSAAAALGETTSIVNELREATDAEDVREVALSRLTVTRTYRWEEKTGEQLPAGWQAAISGSVAAGAEDVNAVADRIAGTGAEIVNLRWELDLDNPAYREVRRAAVAAAHRAAEDFADALDRDLGELRELADPGLLGSDQPPTMMASPMMARGRLEADAGAQLELDPPQIPVTATVEATFEV